MDKSKPIKQVNGICLKEGIDMQKERHLHYCMAMNAEDSLKQTKEKN